MREQPVEIISYKKCAKCGKEGRADAPLCGLCWTRVTPLRAGDPGTYTRPAAEDSAWVSEETARYEETPRRKCPKCGGQVMAAATLCGLCWTHLTPIAG